MFNRVIVFILLLCVPLVGPIFGSLVGFGSASAQTERGAKAAADAPKTLRRVALVIGNGAYLHENNLPRLSNPTNDAEDMAAALRGFDFEVIEHKNLTLERMNQIIAEFGSRIGGTEAALFYFAGHALQVKGRNYLMPVDAKIESEARVPYQGVDINQILDEMDSAKSAANIVMLDACRNNPISGQFRSGATRGLAAPSVAPKGTVIVYATDPGNVAEDGAGRNGLFTSGLLSAFKGQDLSLVGVLTAASEEVERASGRKQTPYVNGPMTLQKNFRFKVTVEPGKGEVERTFWQSIERSSDAADFEAYLRQYPRGSYRALAENRLKQLRAKPVELPSVSPAPTFVADDAEAAVWNEAKSSGAREYLEAYLKQYPKGKFVAFARLELKKLDERDKAERAKVEAEKQQVLGRERQEKQRSEQQAWEQAKGEDTVTAYVGYLRDYPKGRYAMLAEASKQKLQREAAEREKQAAAQAAAEKRAAEERRRKEAAEAVVLAETTAWQACVTEENCRRYLSDYPKGKYAAQAKAEIERLRRLDAEERRAAVERERRETAERLQREAREREEARKQAAADALRREQETREAVAQRKTEAEIRPGKSFKDCSDCPEMVAIPAGSFAMGSNDGDSDEKPVHTVRVSAFALAKTEVTQGQWKAVMGSNPSRFSGCGDDCPVEQVSWDDAQEYVRKLSAKTGKRYRLPSEAEWEYACRAGGNHNYCGGNDVSAVAWYDGNSGSKKHAVAGKQANAFGLYDMSGNVWEWTEDCWNGNYNGAPSDGSAWMAGECARRVLRGGSWFISPRDPRAAIRIGYDSTFRNYGSGLGFRPVRMLL